MRKGIKRNGELKERNESESSVGKNLERNGKNDKDFGDLSYRRGGVLIVSAASFSASETILKTRRCNQRCTRLPTDYDYSFSREQNFPSSSPLLHSFSLSLSLPLLLPLPPLFSILSRYFYSSFREALASRTTDIFRFAAWVNGNDHSTRNTSRSLFPTPARVHA